LHFQCKLFDTYRIHSDKWPFTCNPSTYHFHSQKNATSLNLA
jgi:hypothetical protein